MIYILYLDSKSDNISRLAIVYNVAAMLLNAI